jgi:hypothetical protein
MSILGDSLAKGLRQVTRVTKAKQRSRGRPLSQRDLAWLRAQKEREERESIKAAAWDAMPQAYARASDKGRLPANARQVMYAARPLVLEATGGKCWQRSQYFTQHILPDYIEEHPEETANWDIVFDARGHLHEPHTELQLGLGTLEVRGYIASWHQNGAVSEKVSSFFELPSRWPTTGPANRYRFALFVEKEGFNPLIERSRIRNRFDIMVFSSKGMSVTSARQLVQALSERGVTILVAHDFDLSGLTICHTLSHDTRRFQFDIEPDVIDIGLRLEDVKSNGLQSEPVFINQNKDPRHKFVQQDYDVTNEELNFLVEARAGRGWPGKRVELNAMTSPQFIDWLERKLKEHGVAKIVPDEKTLKSAWRRVTRRIRANREFPDIIKRVNAQKCSTPSNLSKLLRKKLTPGVVRSWDQLLAEMAEKQVITGSKRRNGPRG